MPTPRTEIPGYTDDAGNINESNNLEGAVLLLPSEPAAKDTVDISSSRSGQTSSSVGTSLTHNVTPVVTRNQASTTARNPDSKIKKKRAVLCRKGARVRLRQDHLMHCMVLDDQRAKLRGFPNSRNFYGTIEHGTGKTGYKIRFDDLPAENQTVHIRRRNIITVCEPGEDEAPFDYMDDDMFSEVQKKEKKVNPYHKAIEDFYELDDEIVMNATIFDMHYGHKAGEGEEQPSLPSKIIGK